MRITVLFVGALIGVVCGAAASSEPAAAPLTLDDVARLALENQPNLDALTHAGNAAREASIAESRLPDPQLKFGVQNVPVNGEGAYRLNSEDMTMVTVGVMQEVVRQPVRTAAANRTRAEGEQWDAERVAEGWRIVRDAQLAWVDALDAARRAALLQRMAQELAAEREVAVKRLPSGATDAREVFQLEAMLAMTNDKRLAAENIARKAKAQLSRWIGAPAFRPLPDEFPEPRFIASGTADDQIRNHPQLAALRKAEDAARFEAERARAELTPNWTWELMYGKRQDNRSDLATLQFSLPINWNRANRQDRRLAEKSALSDRAHSVTLDRERELNAELVAALADRDTAQAREHEHIERLIPAAQGRLESARAGYAAGKLPLSAVWEARRGALDVEIEHWMIRADLLRAALRLEYLLGGEKQ